jgi:hypothetical protein
MGTPAGMDTAATATAAMAIASMDIIGSITTRSRNGIS